MVVFRCSAAYSSYVSVVPLTGKGRYLSEKGRSRRFMFLVPKNAEELRRLYESDTPVLAFAFKRRAAEDWAPEHSHARGQLFALTQGLAHRGSRKRTMDVSLPALRMDSTKL